MAYGSTWDQALPHELVDYKPCDYCGIGTQLVLTRTVDNEAKELGIVHVIRPVCEVHMLDFYLGVEPDRGRFFIHSHSKLGMGVPGGTHAACIHPSAPDPPEYI